VFDSILVKNSQEKGLPLSFTAAKAVLDKDPDARSTEELERLVNATKDISFFKQARQRDTLIFHLGSASLPASRSASPSRACLERLPPADSRFHAPEAVCCDDHDAGTVRSFG
jgi:hypothetical protein